jgi:3-oxoadipate enol-lactonase
MAVGFQKYREGDRAGAVDGFLTAVFGRGYRQLLDRIIPEGWEQAVRDADTFFGIEVPELQRWRFGTPETNCITAPVLSLVGADSDPAFNEMEQLLQGLFSRLNDRPRGRSQSFAAASTAATRGGNPGSVLR